MSRQEPDHMVVFISEDNLNYAGIQESAEDWRLGG